MHFSFVKIRQEFPFLRRSFNGRSLAFLDSASTTQKPKVVIDAISDVYSNHYANIHRGVYDLSVEATNLYEGVREKVRKFINARDSAEIIFTRNTTESINLVAYSLGLGLKSGDEILLTEMEHHSNIVPWQMLRSRKSEVGSRIRIKYIPVDHEGRLDFSSVDKFISKKTKIVAFTLMSNVLGTINPAKQIIKKIRSLNSDVRILIDAAQAVGHMKVDVSDLGCDFLVFSAHKMYGPSGVGVLFGKREILEKMEPFMGGGEMIISVSFDETKFNQLPWRFEAGTPNIADVIAFSKTIEFIESLGFDNISKHEIKLTSYALKKLSNDPTLQLYGPTGLANRGPVISFNIDGIHSHDVASILSDMGVAIRSGHHCAQPLMSVLDINAACRISFGVYNTKDEIQRLIDGIEKVKGVFRLTTKARGLRQIKGVSRSSFSVSHP